MNIKCYQTLQLFTSFLFGAFGVLAFSPYDFWPASIVTCTNLLLKIINSTWKQAIYHAMFWGIGFFGNGIYWVYISIAQYGNMHVCINIFLIVCLTLYLTLFPILFVIVLKSIIRIYPHNWNIIIFSPISWSIIEYLRGHIFTGFPWLQFGYTQIDGPLSGIAPIFGVEGITSIIILISALLTLSVKTMQLLPSIISISILFCMWPLKWITWCHLQPKNAIHFSLVQGNINQHIKWNSNCAKIIIQKYLQHTLPILEKKKSSFGQKQQYQAMK